MNKNIKLFDIPEDTYIPDIELVEMPDIEEELRLMSIELEKLLDFDIAN